MSGSATCVRHSAPEPGPLDERPPQRTNGRHDVSGWTAAAGSEEARLVSSLF